MPKLLATPLRLNPDGTFATLEVDETYYAQELFCLVQTEMGERDLAPEYGISDLTYSDVSQSDIQHKVQMFIPPIVITNVSMRHTSDYQATASIEFDVSEPDIDSFDIAIVGGSGRDMEPILDLVDEKLNSKGRILIPCILVDTKVESVNKLKSLGYNPQIVEINVSKN